MELSDMQEQWKKENELLKARVNLNEKLLLEMKLDKALDEFHKLLKLSIAGRNMALVYCAISLGVAISIWDQMAYSIPTFIGALAMLWSFMHHLAIKGPVDQEQLSILQWQKVIEQFRVHSLKSLNADMAVTILWFLAIIPAGLRVILGVDIYGNRALLMITSAVFVGVIYFFTSIGKNAYRTYNQKLKRSRAALENIKAFEEEGDT